MRAVVGGLCGFAVGAIVAAGVVIGGAAIFWVFVFGDNPWPPVAETLLVAVAVFALVVTNIALLISSAVASKRAPDRRLGWLLPVCLGSGVIVLLGVVAATAITLR